MQRAQSNYGQIRVVLTQEADRYMTLRVQAKPFHAQWDEHTVIHRSRVQVTRQPGSLEEAISYLGRTLQGLTELPPPG